MGQGLTVLKFYRHGKGASTRTGWLAHSAAYTRPDPLESADCKGRVSVVTGANSGIGREVAKYLASRGGIVYMVCRNAERAQRERDLIATATGSQSVHVLIGDCGVAADVRRIANELKEREASVHSLVCNAGALSNERKLTSEGHEVTFATHLVMGSYLLTEELRPLLRKAEGARVVCVSSGGMYTVRYDHAVASNAGGPKAYGGNTAYAHAKRGQVMLCEHWAKTAGEPTTFVSCHPGWVDTPAVEQAYGSSKKWLEPMRSAWEGAEGICWLCVAPKEELESGAFYLDRQTQPKHLSNWSKSPPQAATDLAAALAKIVDQSNPTNDGPAAGA